MYDKYGFIVNQDMGSGSSRDEGDSCFFMYFQSLIYCLSGRFNIARKLHDRCEKIHFYRHPMFYCERIPGFVRKDSSFDMLVGWDLLHYMFPEVGLRRPQFERRKSSYWNGRVKNRDMFYFVPALKAELQYFMWRPALGEYYFKNCMIMTKSRIAYERTKSISLLKKMQRFVKFLEDKTIVDDGSIIPNPFFNWLAKLDLGDVRLFREYWGTGLVELEFQRSPLLREEYRKRYATTIFHTEKGMTFSQQFLQWSRG